MRELIARMAEELKSDVQPVVARVARNNCMARRIEMFKGAMFTISEFSFKTLNKYIIIRLQHPL